MISLAVFLDESELPRLHSALNAFTFQHRVIFSFYIRKRILKSTLPTFVAHKYRKQYYRDGIYPMNILRDMSIESIDTSHYVLLDIDVFISTSLGQDIDRNRKLLDDPHNILLIPLFMTTHTKRGVNCKAGGACSHMYESITL